MTTSPIPIHIPQKLEKPPVQVPVGPQSVYRAENNYQLIDPSLVKDALTSLRTVLDGTRPLGMMFLTEGNLAILEKIEGIRLIQSPLESQWIVYRKGEEDKAGKLYEVSKHLAERSKKEGNNRFLYLNRTLDTCETFGRLFSYKEECIQQFKDKIENNLLKELANIIFAIKEAIDKQREVVA